MACSQKADEKPKKNTPTTIAVWESHFLFLAGKSPLGACPKDFAPLRNSAIKRYRTTKEMLPQKADIRLDVKARLSAGITEKTLPRRMYMGKPGECGIPKVALAAEKAAESSQ